MELFSEIERSLSMRRVSARRQEVAATGVESGVQIAVIGANATKFQHRERETFRSQRRSANWLVFFFFVFPHPGLTRARHLHQRIMEVSATSPIAQSIR